MMFALRLAVALTLVSVFGCAEGTLNGVGPDAGPRDLDNPRLDAGARPEDPPPDGGLPSDGTLAVVDAVNLVVADGAVGLDWAEVPGADSYNLYWSTTSGVTREAERIENIHPGYVHRGLTDGVDYFYAVSAVRGSEESSLSDEASARPGGEFVLHRLGTGSVSEVVTASTIKVPIEHRIHVVLLPEGYLASDLARFDNDVDEWFSEVFEVEPYSTFIEAFVVWKLPRASNARISATDPQRADTAFRVPITSSGGGVSSDVPLTGPTAQRVWGALEGFAYPPAAFYPSGGRTSRIAKNLVAHILVLKPSTGRSGMSGRARRLENPRNSSQRISAAIAHNRAHEFSHALTRLKDEYLDVGGSALGTANHLAATSADLSNVVADANCESLPWAHLLVGGAINPDVGQLVGAFGTAQVGYHSEFKCLMNGTHDNDVFYGGDGKLRTQTRLCNFCREVTAFRILERVRVLPDPDVSFDEWTRTYRVPFYQAFGFSVPADVPQRNSSGSAVFEACGR